MPSAVARLLAASAVAVAVGPAGAAEGDKSVPVTIALEDQANVIWTDLPEAMPDGRVTRLGRTSESCAADALRQAKGSAQALQGGRLALRDLKLTVSLPRTLLKASRTPGTGYLADVLGHYLRSSSEDDFVSRAAPWRTRATRETADAVAALRSLYGQLVQARSDHALLPVLDAGCGPGLIAYDLRALPGQPGRLYLSLLVEGGCSCRGGVNAGVRPRRFRVLGRAELESGIRTFDDKGVLVRMRAKQPRYFVLAACRACDGETDTAAQAAQTPVGPCAEPCAPLGESLSGWQQEARRVEAEVSALKERTAAVQADLGTKQKELESAQALRQKPRSVAERIAALSEQVKDAQAELGRVSSVAADAGRHLDEVRGALDDAQASGRRCQAQCPAQQQAQRTPPSTQAARGGGGIGTGTLIAGGGAVAAGAAAAAVLAGRGDDAPRGVAGTWAGTRIINNGPLFDNCTRVFDEVWNIQQMGLDLVADAEAIGRDCGNAGCPQSCQLFPFPWHMPGTVEGSTYRFVVFGGTACILSLRISGDTLSGDMSPCNESPGMTQHVSLTRRR